MFFYKLSAIRRLGLVSILPRYCSRNSSDPDLVVPLLYRFSNVACCVHSHLPSTQRLLLFALASAGTSKAENTTVSSYARGVRKLSDFLILHGKVSGPSNLGLGPRSMSHALLINTCQLEGSDTGHGVRVSRL